MVKAKVFKVAKIFEGPIKESDLVLEEEELPALEDGEYLAECLSLSVDPYMRAGARTYTVGQIMIGIQVAKVIASKDIIFPIGTVIVGNLGWRTHTTIKPSDDYDVYALPNIGTLPMSLGLGVLGATGISAYFGFLEICEPKKGETVVISAAGGAVGSHVGQIAKIKGCRVVGITGSDEKAQWIKSLGFDDVINYKTVSNLGEALRKAAPNGIDCYFDNVGGEMSSTILQHMNVGGRVSICGAISAYNSTTLDKATVVQPFIVSKQLTLQGFIRRQYKARWGEAIRQNIKWVQEGSIKYRETITEGFENATKALIGVMKGENIGKAVVRVKASVVEDSQMDFKSALNMFKKLQNK